MNNNAVVERAQAQQPVALRPDSEAGALIQVITRAAADPSIDIEKMERLLKMQAEIMAKRAEGEFIGAMSQFKAHAPRIAKDKRVNFTSQKGTTDYRHATLGAICAVVDPLLGPVGLSYRWLTEQIEGGQVRVTCIVTHVGSHSERTALMSGRDESGNKNNIQALGSAVKYLQRYTLMSALGLSDSDDEDDGQASSNEPRLDENQIANIEALLSEVGANKQQFLDYIKADSIEDIYARNYETVVKTIEAKRRMNARRAK